MSISCTRPSTRRPPGSPVGQLTHSGIFIRLSKSNAPLRSSRWLPAWSPWSATKTTRVLSSTPSSRSPAINLPMHESTADTMPR